MKKRIIIICLLFSLLSSAAVLPDPPKSVISNKLVTANLYLPDANKGYYQATRFDWAGVIASLEYKGHSYFGQWFENYSPKTHDAVIGPVEAFDPVGYDEAKLGGTFVKIGVGILRKPLEKMYNSFKLYEITDGGKWTVDRKKDRVQFTQELHDSTGYAYIYTKTVRLVKDKPQLVLEHSLKNIGQKIIETEVFDHNFPVIDKEPTNPAMKITFPFQVKAEGKGWGTLAETKGNEIIFLRELAKKEQVYSAGLQGFGPTAKDYDFNIQNQKTGAGIKITGDQPIEKLVFWASSTTACPEPYIKIKIDPGKEMKWNINYEFYTFSPANNSNTK
ncbi:MAG: hypothetical protein JWR67_4032 [Mucilaginibacter sp.]|nr:hypothetical protein [Mucilaginibacter sp.]